MLVCAFSASAKDACSPQIKGEPKSSYAPVSSQPLIDMLCVSIEKYEDTAEEFKGFNDRLKQLNSGVAALSVLMDQHKLNTTDFENEIGKKSLVSLILNEKRPLNLNHIRKLSERFNVPPQTFI